MSWLITVKPVLSGHSKRRPKLVFKTDYRLMQVKSIAECFKGSILQCFRPSLNCLLPLRPLFVLFSVAALDRFYCNTLDLIFTCVSNAAVSFSWSEEEPSCKINRGSYMNAHVLLNLLNELGKRDKMRGLPSILSLFRNEFNKFNNTGARMLDSIYHMTLNLF